MQGFIISDLHLLTYRTIYDQYREEVELKLSHSDFFILNGDIVDFRWSIYGSLEKSVSNAELWLRHFCSINPSCTVHYMIGNHDHNQLWMDRLENLSQELGNLHVHQDFLRLGNNLICHGDASQHPSKTKLQKYRQHYLWEKPKLRVLGAVYGLFAWLRFTTLAYLGESRRLNVHRLSCYLEAVDPGWAEVEVVYFGHTHVGFSGYRFEGRTFHNTGCMVRGLRPLIHEVRT